MSESEKKEKKSYQDMKKWAFNFISEPKNMKTIMRAIWGYWTFLFGAGFLIFLLLFVFSTNWYYFLLALLMCFFTLRCALKLMEFYPRSYILLVRFRAWKDELLKKLKAPRL